MHPQMESDALSLYLMVFDEKIAMLMTCREPTRGMTSLY